MEEQRGSAEIEISKKAKDGSLPASPAGHLGGKAEHCALQLDSSAVNVG